MSDVHLAKKDWVQLRKAKLFMVPAIATAYYEGTVTKADLVRATSNSLQTKDKVTTRISSDICGGVPVTHEKAEAALNAYNTISTVPAVKKLNKDKDIVASVFRPLPVLKSATVDLFGVGNQVIPLITELCGLRPKTIQNVLNKGRMNAHTCIRLAQSALSVRLYFGLGPEFAAGFSRLDLMNALISAADRSDIAGFLSVAGGADAQFSLMEEFIKYVGQIDANGDDGVQELVNLAATPLRDFFTPDHVVAFAKISQDAAEDYLLDEADQVAAPDEWREWTIR